MDLPYMQFNRACGRATLAFKIVADASASWGEYLVRDAPDPVGAVAQCIAIG